MKSSARSDRLLAAATPTRLFAERRDDDKPPISDDTYERIPEKFKSGPSRREDRRQAPPPPPHMDEPPRRSSLSRFLFILAVVAFVVIAYQAFFVSKSTEITWTAFNAALDGKRLETGEVKGSTISGKFRDFPSIAEWWEMIPDGRKEFDLAIAQYDREHSDIAKEYENSLKEELEDCKVDLLVKDDSSDGAETRLVLALKLKDGAIARSTEISRDASSEERELEARALLKNYEFARRLEMRWKLAPIGKGGFGVKDAMQVVDSRTEKPFGKVFFKNYHCVTPAFAFNDQTLDRRMRENLDSYTSATATDGSWWLTVLSVVLTIVFFIFLFRMMRSTRDQFMGGGLGVARSLAKKYDPSANTRVTFEDVAGMDQVKAELVEVVDYLKNPSKYERMGARVPKGTLLFGPPGTGKTLLARAVAGEANVPFYSINGSEFIQMFVGVGASRVRDIFSTAKENAPSILFIDEIDAVGRQRGAGVGGGQDEREQTLNQILSEMDGFAQNESVMVMASTNRPDVLDPALMRPGRFDRHITVGRPSMKGRVDIFKVYLKKIPYASDVDVDKLAKQTSGFTGADIRNYVNEATLWATRNNKNQVEASDFDFAFEKIALGLKRDEIISEENKRKTACHEAGHAIVGWFLPNGSTVHKVTIIPRGRALGVTWSLPDEDKLSYDASEARATLAHLLAGRAAEKLTSGETTSGVENDLQRATDLARDMVARWGMSERLGPVSFPSSETHPFLGREMTTDVRAYSEATAELIDEEIKRIVNEADEQARAILVEKRDLFDKLVDALVEEEEIDRARLLEILGPGPNDPSPEENASSETSEPSAPQEESAFAGPLEISEDEVVNLDFVDEDDHSEK